MTPTLTSAASPTEQRPGGGPGTPFVLLNHPTQSAAAIDGWKAVFFGLPFLLAGVVIECAALHLLRGHTNAPNWLIGLIGAFFFSAGAFLVVHGLRGAARKSEYERESAARPDEPWLADYHWQREGVAFSAFYSMLQRLVAALVWNAFLIPLFWVGLNQRGFGRLFLVIAGLFALIGLVFWARWIHMLADLLRYGSSFLCYDEFPYLLGQTLRVHLRAPLHVSSMNQLVLTLRCVQEKYLTTGSGNNRRTLVVCYELYRDAVTLSQTQLATGHAGCDIPVAFRLPQDQPPSTLVETPPTYWEIEVRGKARGVDYEAYFLVPVYKRL
jgi:hypothetical protein